MLKNVLCARRRVSRPDSMSMGSAHPEAAARGAQANAGHKPDHEVPSGTVI